MAKKKKAKKKVSKKDEEQQPQEEQPEDNNEATAEELLSALDIIERHKMVLSYLYDIIPKVKTPCIAVTTLAEESEYDESVIVWHLRLMEVDGIGVFLTEDETHFCPLFMMDTLKQRLNEQRLGK